MIITITGTPGSGKSTIGKALAKRLGYEFFSTGSFRRQMAKEQGMTLEEYNRLGETDPSTDKIADEYQSKLAKEKDNIIIDGKTAFHFVPESVKIYITASEDVRAKRIFEDDTLRRNQQKAKDVEEQKKLNKERMEVDIFRYKKYYDLDTLDLSKFDFVLDTTSESDVEKNVDRIIEFLQIEKARDRMRNGNFYTAEEAKKRLGL
jgi:CMP/dCMP kinase